MRRLWSISIFMSALVLTASLLEHLDAPWPWVFGLWCALVLAAAVSRRRTRWVWVLLPIATVLLVAAIAEMGAARTYGRVFEGDHYGGYLWHDPRLGPAPVPGATTTARRVSHGALEYEATYHIGQDGFRRTPSPQGEGGGASVLCVGGSYTFGEGLPDDASWPWRLAEALDRRYHVHNIAFHGWGPHQALAVLDDGRLERLAGTPHAVVYLGIPDHIHRVAGRYDWGRASPRYVRAGDGGFDWAGSFQDQDWRPSGRLECAVNWLRSVADKSTLVRLLRCPGRFHEEDKAFYVDLVAYLGRRIRSSFPGCALHVIWGGEDDAAAALEAEGLQVHRLADILPGYPEEERAYWVSPHDSHPNAHACELIAAYVADLVRASGSGRQGG